MNASPGDTPAQPSDGLERSDRRPNQLGRLAAIAGVVGFILFFSFDRGLGLTVAFGATLAGFVARSQARSQNLRTGMANVGIICGPLLGALYALILYFESIWPV